MTSLGPISIFSIVVASVCFTIALLHLISWLQRRDQYVFLAFSVSFLGVAGFAIGEVFMLRASTPEAFGEALRWIHIPAWVCLLGYAWFIRLHLRVRQFWLFWLIVVGRTAQLILNFVFYPNINFLEITSIRQSALLGESFSVPVGVPNSLMLIGQISSLLLIAYITLGVINEWRFGDRKRSAVTGIASAICAVGFFGVPVAIYWENFSIPLMASPFFSGMIAVMGFYLAIEASRAFALTEKVRKSARDLGVAREMTTLINRIGNAGVLIVDPSNNEHWASESLHDLFGIERSEKLSFERIFERVTPEDLGKLVNTQNLVLAERREIDVEYRIILPDGTSKWIRSFFGISTEDGVEKLAIASADVTDLKESEAIAHSISGRLIAAQEAERSRIARELHDDVSQSLALISIRLDVLGQLAGVEKADLLQQIEDLVSDVKILSADVHKMSYELHPSKLRQLGLKAAIRGLCREIEEAYGLRIKTRLESLEVSVPSDVALIIYRIVQESLQNVVKHAAARAAEVNVLTVSDRIQLSVSDDGCGFDPKVATHSSALGLIGMEERVHLVGGTLSIESTSATGTCITVSVPLNASGNEVAQSSDG
jgi:signal transduction histidine kinase